MTKRDRTVLFFTLTLLFILAAPSILLYSQGYRVNWQELRITQTGAFFVNASPSRTTVLVNDISQKKTDYIFGSALTRNFVPGEYTLQVAKEGYHSWTKNLSLVAQEVTEAKNVTLIPKDIQFQVVYNNVQEFWSSPDQQYILLLLENENAWSLVLQDTTANTKTVVYEQATSTEQVWNVQWGTNRFLVELANQEQIERFIYHTKTQGCIPCVLDFIPQKASGLQFFQDNLLYLDTTNTLYEADYKNKKLLEPAALDIVAYTIEGETLVWLDTTGMLFEKNITQELTKRPLLQKPIGFAKETPYSVYRIAGKTFLQERNTLFVLENQSLQELLTTAKLVTSPDTEKLALLNNTELWIYYVQAQEDQPRKKAGEQTFLNRFSTSIHNAVWLNSHYMLFTTHSTVSITEIDDRNGLNIVEIGTFKDPKLFWQAQNKTLYILSEKTLLRSKKIL